MIPILSLFACFSHNKSTDTCPSSTDAGRVDSGACQMGATTSSGADHYNCSGNCVSPLSGAWSHPTEAEARSCASDTGMYYSETTCCGLTVIRCTDDYGGPTYYFDSSGVLVTVIEGTDAPEFCSSATDTASLWITYGQIPPRECW